MLENEIWLSPTDTNLTSKVKKEEIQACVCRAAQFL